MTAETIALKTMINAYYGITKTPFETDEKLENELLKHYCSYLTNDGTLSYLIALSSAGIAFFTSSVKRLKSKPKASVTNSKKKS